MYSLSMFFPITNPFKIFVLLFCFSAFNPTVPAQLNVLIFNCLLYIQADMILRGGVAE